jgi:hypothetical protein
MNSVRYILSDILGFNDIINSTNTDVSNVLKLNKIDCKTNNNTSYKIIRYDKNFLTYDLVSSYGLCRSVIVNSKNKVVGFAPPKSILCDDFIRKYSENTTDIVAEQFVEGTMINVFWDDLAGWEISTRNTIGATSSFYKGSKTFREMFIEACNKNN